MGELYTSKECVSTDTMGNKLKLLSTKMHHESAEESAFVARQEAHLTVNGVRSRNQTLILEPYS